MCVQSSWKLLHYTLFFSQALAQEPDPALIQCTLDVRGGCVPRLTENSENPRIIYAPSLVTPLSEKHFLVSVHPTVSV
jgi:hypothetical protein